MKVTFIQPAATEKNHAHFTSTWMLEPMPFALLKGLTPPHIETLFYDDRLETVVYDESADLAVIMLESHTALRAYEIAHNFRKLGVPVVAGGTHAQAAAKEAARFCDCVVTGSIENIWIKLLSDLTLGNLKKYYYSDPVYREVRPDKSIFEGKDYLPVSVVKTGWGSPRNDNCDRVPAYYLQTYNPRPQQEVLRDICYAEHPVCFLTGADFTVNRRYALSLCDQIRPIQTSWMAQGTLALAKDAALLSAMSDTGCKLLVLHFENLGMAVSENKKQSCGQILEEWDLLVNRIHGLGMGICAIFTVGTDKDTEWTILQTLNFAKSHRLFTVEINQMLPPPGSALYAKLKSDGRLLYERWWLQREYRSGEAVFAPHYVSSKKISKLCTAAKADIFSLSMTTYRGLANTRRTGTRLWPLFWRINAQTGGEVNLK